MSRWGLWWYEVVLKKFIFLPTTVRMYANIVFIVYDVVFRATHHFLLNSQSMNSHTTNPS